MVDRTPIYVEVDEAGNVTNLAEFVADTDIIPESMGGTGGVALSATTGLVYDSAAGTLTTADDVETVTFVGGSEKLIARHVHVSNTLSGGPDCSTTLSTSASVSGCPFPPPFK
jgi:hypothetical protein